MSEIKIFVNAGSVKAEISGEINSVKKTALAFLNEFSDFPGFSVLPEKIKEVRSGAEKTKTKKEDSLDLRPQASLQDTLDYIVSMPTRHAVSRLEKTSPHSGTTKNIAALLEDKRLRMVEDFYTDSKGYKRTMNAVYLVDEPVPDQPTFGLAKARALQWIHEHPGCSVKWTADRCGVLRSRAEKCIDALIASGDIVMQMDTKKGYAVAYSAEYNKAMHGAT